MKKKTIALLSLTAFSLFAMGAVLLQDSLSAANGYKLGDSTFAKKLCSRWNSSKLPKKLGSESTGGSGWIDVVTGVSTVPAGYQKLVSGRADCKGWPKFQLVLEKQADGSAKCTSGGAYDGSKRTWQFLPATESWFEYAMDFGMMAFASLWNNGMKGKYATAYANKGNFKIFFRQAAILGYYSDWKSGCSGLDTEDAQEAVDDLKKAWKLK